ncbi:MAG: vWA domain-containing protein [Oligoflexus sp.]
MRVFVGLIGLYVMTLILACQETEFVENRRAKAITEDDFLTQIFQPAELVSTEVSYEPENQFVHQLVEMKEPRRYQEEWVQISRPVERTRFFQGHDGFEEREVLSLREAGLLDVLIVMDDSSSMHPYQELMQSRFQDLLSRVSNTDWQIAVVTTTSSCLRQSSDGVKILRRDDYRRSPEATQRRFQELITPGEYGNTFERGILMATEGLLGDCGNPSAGWTRENSEKAVFIISDEKNCGSASNEGCADAEYAKADYFLQRAPAGSRVYGLFHFRDNAVECPQSGGYEDMYPREYQRLVEATGGFSEEICQPDYTLVMMQLSAHVSEFVRKVFNLKYPPVTQTVQLELDGNPLQNGYRIDGKNLFLDIDIDNPDTLVTISYRHNPVPIVDQFTFDQPVDPETLLVHINQALVPPSTYQFDHERRVLRFHERPQARSTIDAEYKQLGYLKQSFTTNLPEDLHEMVVYINQQRTKNFTWDPSWQQLRFQKPPQDGAKVRLEYSRQQDLGLEYQIEGLSPDMIHDYWVEDPESGEVFDFNVQISDARLSFPIQEFMPGRQFKIVYQLQIPDRTKPIVWEMPDYLVEESLQVRSAADDVTCGRELLLEDKRLMFACESADRLGFSINFQYYENFKTRFHVDPYERMPGKWQVWVSDNEVFDFQRQDGWLIFTEDQIQPEDSVRVRGYIGD